MTQADVIILGGGLVGLTLAIAVDRHGLTSIVVDPADPEKTLTPQYDGRATAVASASWRMLEAIGVGERLEGQGCPIQSIRVSDGLEPGGLVFDPPGGDDPLGRTFETRLLPSALPQPSAGAPATDRAMPPRPPGALRACAR